MSISNALSSQLSASPLHSLDFLSCTPVIDKPSIINANWRLKLWKWLLLRKILREAIGKKICTHENHMLSRECWWRLACCCQIVRCALLCFALLQTLLLYLFCAPVLRASTKIDRLSNQIFEIALRKRSCPGSFSSDSDYIGDLCMKCMKWNPHPRLNVLILGPSFSNFFTFQPSAKNNFGKNLKLPWIFQAWDTNIKFHDFPDFPGPSAPCGSLLTFIVVFVVVHRTGHDYTNIELRLGESIDIRGLVVGTIQFGLWLVN